MPNIVKGILFICVLSFFISCSPIEEYEAPLEKIEKQIENEDFTNKVVQTSANILALSPNQAYRQVITEDVLAQDRSAQIAILANIHQYAKELRAMEDLSDTSENRQAAEAKFKQLEGEINELSKSLVNWQDKYGRVSNLITNADQVKQEIVKAQAAFDKAKPALWAKFDKAIKDHPHQEARINEFKGYLNNIDNDYKAITTLLSTQPGSVSAQKYFEHLALYEGLNATENYPVTLINSYSKKIDELYTSYNKTLKGMSEQYAVELAGVSWDDGSSTQTEYARRFPFTLISRADLKALEEEIATYSAWTLGAIYQSELISRATDGNSRTGWHSNTNTARIWIENLDSQFTHEYVIVEGGKSRVEQQQVSEQTYNDLIKAAGLAVFSKPYGMFADEAIDIPHEVGMAYVGNKAYGEWQRDPITGQDIWVWLAAYAIFDNLTDRKINRARYNNYNSRLRNGYVPIYKRKAYKDQMRYGFSSYVPPVRSSYTRARHNSSPFAKGTSLSSRSGKATFSKPTRTSTSSYRSTRNSIKGQGTSFRNRGPAKGK